MRRLGFRRRNDAPAEDDGDPPSLRHRLFRMALPKRIQTPSAPSTPTGSKDVRRTHTPPPTCPARTSPSFFGGGSLRSLTKDQLIDHIETVLRTPTPTARDRSFSSGDNGLGLPDGAAPNPPRTKSACAAEFSVLATPGVLMPPPHPRRSATSSVTAMSEDGEDDRLRQLQAQVDALATDQEKAKRTIAELRAELARVTGASSEDGADLQGELAAARVALANMSWEMENRLTEQRRRLTGEHDGTKAQLKAALERVSSLSAALDNKEGRLGTLVTANNTLKVENQVLRVENYRHRLGLHGLVPQAQGEQGEGEDEDPPGPARRSSFTRDLSLTLDEWDTWWRFSKSKHPPSHVRDIGLPTPEAPPSPTPQDGMSLPHTTSDPALGAASRRRRVEDALAGLVLFQSMAPLELAVVSAACVSKAYANNDVVYDSAAVGATAVPTDALFVVLDGSVAVLSPHVVLSDKNPGGLAVSASSVSLAGAELPRASPTPPPMIVAHVASAPPPPPPPPDTAPPEGFRPVRVPTRHAASPPATSPTFVTRLHQGDVFVTADIRDGQRCVAAGDATCAVLSSAALASILRWLADARRIPRVTLLPRPRHRNSRRFSTLAQDNTAACRKLLDECTTKQQYIDVLQAFRHAFQHLPLPSLHRCIKAPDVEQARKDFARETSVLLNGTVYALGDAPQLGAFVRALAEAVAVEVLGQSPGMVDHSALLEVWCPVARTQGPTLMRVRSAEAALRSDSRSSYPAFSSGVDTDGDTTDEDDDDAGLSAHPVATSDEEVLELRLGHRPRRRSHLRRQVHVPVSPGRRPPRAVQLKDLTQSTTENLVAALVGYVLVHASRTVTGGDSYTQCMGVFGCPDVVLIAAETGPTSPSEVSVHAGRVVIQSVNTYRVCGLEDMCDGGPKACALLRSVVTHESTTRPPHDILARAAAKAVGGLSPAAAAHTEGVVHGVVLGSGLPRTLSAASGSQASLGRVGSWVFTDSESDEEGGDRHAMYTLEDAVVSTRRSVSISCHTL